MPSIGRRDLVLALVGLDKDGLPDDEVGGITRLQKYLYLLEHEEGLRPHGTGFDFIPYKAGPYSSKLYDDLEFLENLGLLESEISAEATDAEKAELKYEHELEDLTFDDLINDSEGSESSDLYEERRFRLTAEGRRRVEKLLEDGKLQPIVGAIRKVKSRYGSHSLQDLLYYVYTKYPEMTVESEIFDQVMARRR